MNSVPMPELQRILLDLDSDLRNLNAAVHMLAERLSADGLPSDRPPAPIRGARPEPGGQDSPRWSLRDQGWSLVSPDGKTLSLTTAEREFMTCLLSSPDHRMARSQLYAQTRAYSGNALTASGTESRGLDVMVSRLRRKAQMNGMRLPLRSVRRWGYMFTGDADDA